MPWRTCSSGSFASMKCVSSFIMLKAIFQASFRSCTFRFVFYRNRMQSLLSSEIHCFFPLEMQILSTFITYLVDKFHSSWSEVSGFELGTSRVPALKTEHFCHWWDPDVSLPVFCPGDTSSPGCFASIPFRPQQFASGHFAHETFRPQTFPIFKISDRLQILNIA